MYCKKSMNDCYHPLSTTTLKNHIKRLKGKDSHLAYIFTAVDKFSFFSPARSVDLASSTAECVNLAFSRPQCDSRYTYHTSQPRVQSPQKPCKSAVRAILVLPQPHIILCLQIFALPLFLPHIPCTQKTTVKIDKQRLCRQTNRKTCRRTKIASPSKIRFFEEAKSPRMER